MADAPQTLNQLSPEIQQRLKNLSASGNATIEDFTNLLKNSGIDAEAATELARQAARDREYRAVLSPAIDQMPRETFKPQISGGGNILASLGVGALAFAGRDDSGAGEILADVNNRQMDELLSENGPFHDALVRGDTQTIEQNLHLLDPDNILDKQFDTLRSRLETPMDADEKTQKKYGDARKRMEDKYIELKTAREKEKNNPNKSKRQQKRDKEQAEFAQKRKKRLLTELADIDAKPQYRKLDAKQKYEKRQALLHQYAREQQWKNSTHFYNLLAKKGGLLGFGRKSTIPQIKRVIIQNIRKEQKDKAKATKEKKKAQEFEKQRPEESISEFQRSQYHLPQQPISIGNDPYTSVPESSAPSSPSFRLPGIPGKSVAAKAFLGIGWEPIAIGVGILFLIIFVVIIIIIILNATSGSQPLPEVQLTCGNKIPENMLRDWKLIKGRIDSEFHVGFDLSRLNSQADPTNLSVIENAYSTICLLFGQPEGSAYVQKQYNTFGKDTVGNYGQQIGESDKKVSFIAFPSQQGYPNCSIQPVGNPEKDNAITWDFIAPDKCSSLYQFQFRIAHALAYSLLYQQEYLGQQKAGSGQYAPSSVIDTIKTVFPDFSPITIGHALPTAGCTKAIGTTNYLPECFADMVGEYLTYPYYVDGSALGTHGAFIAGTPAEIDLAAKAGMSYIINYHWQGESALDPNSPAGQELAKYHMHAFLDVHQLINGNCGVDPTAVADLVKQYYQSPLLGGYWIKDDDLGCDMKPAIKTIHDTIRTIDSDTNHVIMAGYGVASSMSNYEDGIADVLAFYPYPAYNEGHTVEWEIQQMLGAEKKATPPGKTPPPFVGVYQAFWGDDTNNGDCRRHNIASMLSQSIVLDNVNTFLNNGAISIVAFSIGRPCDVNYTGETDPTIMDQIYAVRDLLGLHPL